MPSSSDWTRELVTRYKLSVHPEGGYYTETDRSSLMIPNVLNTLASDTDTRCTSTTIFYLLTYERPSGYFHRNKSRTVHCLHEGRGIYAILYPPNHTQSRTAMIESTTKGLYQREILSSGWTLETFEVGSDAGVYQWLVEGGLYKASYLRSFDVGDSEACTLQIVPNSLTAMKEELGLFISEVVSPGFEFHDHNFLSALEHSQIFGDRSASFQTLLNPKT